MSCQGVFCAVLLLPFFAQGASAEDESAGKVRIITEWKDDELPIRVDCQNIPIVGGGIGGASQSCEARLSLYATFSCFPTKKEDVEASCPEWNGLKADVDWDRVAQLIDARDANNQKQKDALKKTVSILQKVDDGESRKE